MSDDLLIYGGNGFTGKLIARNLVTNGIRPILAGRNQAKLAPVAAELGLEYRIVNLGDPQGLDRALADVDVGLLAAGPFSATYQPFVESCLRTRTHYLDVTGEVPVIEALAHYDEEARAQGITIMPSVGFDVVPSDCLSLHVAKRLPNATRLLLGFTGLEFTTRGSAKTLMELAGFGVNIRRDGQLRRLPAGELRREFDYGWGPSLGINVGWGDVSCAYYTTGIPNIEVYFDDLTGLRVMMGASRLASPVLAMPQWQAIAKSWMDMLPEGPTDQQRASKQMVIVAEVEDAAGNLSISRMTTPEAYTFTGIVASAVARSVLDKRYATGFQTAARVYGPDYVLPLTGVSREDIQ